LPDKENCGKILPVIPKGHRIRRMEQKKANFDAHRVPVEVDYCERIAENLEDLVNRAPSRQFLTKKDAYNWQKRIEDAFDTFMDVLVWLQSEEAKGTVYAGITWQELREMRKRVQDDMREVVGEAMRASESHWCSRVSTGMTNLARRLRDIVDAARKPAETGREGKAVAVKERPEQKPVEAERKDIWEDIQPGMKEAIQEFWKESKAKKSEGKRPLIKTFCRERDLDERTFRSEKDRVEKRRKRLEKAD